MSDSGGVIYRELRPSPALAAFVERLWWLEGEASELGAEPILPDGHTEIIVHAGDPFAEVGADGTARVQRRVLLAGQTSTAVRIAPRGRARVAGARLRPDAAYRLLGVPQRELTNRIVELSLLDRRLARRLRDDVATRKSGEEVVSALNAALEVAVRNNPRRGSLAASAGRATRAAVSMATRRAGLVRVAELARHAGVGARQLERLFHERVGLPPKTFLRILRFQNALAAVRDGPRNPRWVDLAQSLGFYDQPHFIRDFKDFTGETPGAFRIGAESLTAVFSAVRRGAEPTANDVAFFQDSPSFSA